MDIACPLCVSRNVYTREIAVELFICRCADCDAAFTVQRGTPHHEPIAPRESIAAPSTPN